jgi:hypothetical protein
MIKESKSEYILMLGSFVLCFASIAGILFVTAQGKMGVGLLLVLFAFLMLVMHGRSSATLVEKDAIGKAISYHDLKDKTAFRIVEEIGSGYYKVAPAGSEEKTAQLYAKIVTDLPQNIAVVGCIFLKKKKELFIKPHAMELSKQ